MLNPDIFCFDDGVVDQDQLASKKAAGQDLRWHCYFTHADN